MMRLLHSVLLLCLLLPATLEAQQLVIRGRVIGPDGTTLPDQRVLLHRVDRTGGATIAETNSTAEGTFLLTAPPASDTAAVYFLAGRYEGELYIGQMFRTAGADTLDQVLHVGIAETSASAMLEQAEAPPGPAPRTASRTNWLLFIIPLLGVAAAVIYLILPRRRIAPERALLIRIAEIDERMDAAPPGQRDTMRAERAQLVEQLRVG